MVKPIKFFGLVSARTVTISGIILLVVGWGLGVWNGWRYAEELRTLDATHALLISRFRWVVLLFGLAPLTALLIRLWKERSAFLASIRTWLSPRVAVYFALAAVGITSIAHTHNLFEGSKLLMRCFFNSTLLVSLNLWALIVLAPAAAFTHPARGLLRITDVVLANLVITLLILEGTLSVWARFSHSPIFWDMSSTVSTLAKYRQKPYRQYFNFTFNSGGYHDTEFFTAENDDFVVGLLADSFGMGVVPYDYHFATVAERHLQEVLADQYQRIAVHNFGIPCIGVSEYALLLETEVLEKRPKLILLCVFVGNDIEGLQRRRGGRYCFQRWWG